MIRLNNIEKTYETPQGSLQALYPLSFQVKRGEIFGIVGQSGAGKSTLLRCINLLEKPTRGSVIVDGINLTELPEAELRSHRHRIGMIFQHFNLLGSKTVFENIALPLKLLPASQRPSKSAIHKKVESLLELTGLPDKIHAYPAQLSGGQKQRVAIARALACDPTILLCDEATSALDPQTTQSILSLLLDINCKLDLTIVLITHEMEVVKSICTEVVLLEQGRIIEQGNTVHLFKNPQTPQAKEWGKSCLKQELPLTLQERIVSEPGEGLMPVLRVIFSGNTANEPLISDLVQTHRVQVNILQANIEYVHQEALGIMVLKIESAPMPIDALIQLLQNKNIQVEIVGYVR